MQLVDKEDDLPLALFYLVEHALEPLLKLAAVLGPRHQRAHVEAEHLAVLEVFRHVPAHDPLGQPLGDGGFAHARLADQAGVVLALAAQNADHVADLGVPADHRVQLLLAGQAHQLLAVLLQHVVGVLRVVAGHPLAAPHLGQRLQELRLVNAELLRQGRGRAAVFEQGQKEMLDADILVLHRLGLAPGRLQHRVSGLRDVDLVRLPPRAAHPRQGADLLLGRPGKGGGVGPHPLQQLADQAVFLAAERGEQMLRRDLLVLIFNGKALCRLQSLHRLLGKLVGVHNQALLCVGK